MSRRAHLIVLIAVFGLLVVGFFVFSLFNTKTDENSRSTHTKQQALNYATTTITVGDTAIVVDIADTPQKRQRGLSGRRSLEDDRGMLFVFPHSDTYSFWMKNMHFPIDIIWIDATEKVVHVKQNATPNSFPESFQPSKPARYVLETNVGALRNISIGQVIHIP